MPEFNESTMELLKYTLLVTIIFDLFVAFWVIFFRTTERSLLKAYILMYIPIIIWEGDMYVQYFVKVSQWATNLVDNLAYSSGVLAAATVTYFSWELTSRKHLKKIIVYLIAAVSFLFAYISFIGGLMSQGRIYYSSTVYHFVVKPGPLLIWLYSFIVCAFILSTWMVLTELHRSHGLRRIQLTYISIGLLSAFTVAIISNVLIEIIVKYLLDDYSLTASIYYIAAQIIGAISVTVFSIFVAYAMTRYRFMDIKVVLKKSVVYGTALLCTVGLYVYLLWFLYSLLPNVIVWIFGLLVYTLLWNLYSRKLKYVLDRLFFMDELDLSKRIDERLHKLNSTYELEMFVVELIRSIEDTVHIPVHSMYIAEREHNHFRQYYPHGERGSISFDDELVETLRQMPLIIIKDEVGLQHTDVSQCLTKELKKHDAEAILQIQKDHAPIGIIFIGSKKDQKPYLSNEIRELQHVITNAQQQLFAVIQYHEALEGARKTIHEASYSMTNQNQSI